jgi:hypothetical protein
MADRGGDADGCEEVGGVSVVSCGDAPEVLKSAEHALDGVAVAVEERREAVLPFAVGFGRDVRRRAPLLDLAADGVGVVAFVGVQDVAIWELFKQQGARCAVGDLAAGEHEGERSAVGVGQRVDFRRAPAARAADGLIFLPPFPPAAERWAFTAEESRRTWSGGPPACASA